MVGTEPTVAAGRKTATKPTHADNITPLPSEKELQMEHINNNYNTPQLEHTIAKKHNRQYTKPANNLDSRAYIYIGAEPPTRPEIQEGGTPNPARKSGHPE